MTLFSDIQARILGQFGKYSVEDIPIYIVVNVTGSGWTENGVKTIITGYFDALDPGDDVVAADIETLLLADSTIDTVENLHISRVDFDDWDGTSYSETTLKIFQVEQAVTDTDKIFFPTEVDIYVYFNRSPGYGASRIDTIRTALAAYINGLGVGVDVSHDALVGVVEAIDTVDTVHLDTSGPPDPLMPQVDLTISQTQIARTYDNSSYIDGVGLG